MVTSCDLDKYRSYRHLGMFHGEHEPDQFITNIDFQLRFIEI